MGTLFFVRTTIYIYIGLLDSEKTRKEGERNLKRRFVVASEAFSATRIISAEAEKKPWRGETLKTDTVVVTQQKKLGGETLSLR